MTFHEASSSPQIIESIELLQFKGTWLVRSRTVDGGVGIAATTSRIDYLHPILTERIVPYFIGRDARQLPDLIDGVYRHHSNYKLVGLPFWSCVAWVEFSLVDLLGRVAKQPAGQMLGPVIRRHVPVYLSVLDRKSPPEKIAELLRDRLARTGAKAVKVKIGGRMSGNADAAPGRSADLLNTLRRVLPGDTTICVDANGSYDAETAIQVGRMLEEHGVGLFEEPCPFECYDETRRVAEALHLPVAGGEQDSSALRWKDMLRDHVVDVPQPDVIYNGGLVRTARVATMAEANGRQVSFHNPHQGPSAAYALHLASVITNPWSFHEFNVHHHSEAWYEPRLDVVGGMLAVPVTPGLGVEFDPSALARATLRHRARRFARVVLGRVTGLV